MRQLEDYVDPEKFLELQPQDVGEFCEGALDAGLLIEELEEFGPFRRKGFCEFLGIGESTLTGWLKAERMPRAAKVAYILLIGMTLLQAEVQRLRRDARELKIVQDGETFHLVRFETDETGVSIGKFVARDIPNGKTARVLAGSVQAFLMLREARGVIGDMLERTENARYREQLENLDSRIRKETLAAFEPEKWQEAFGPYSLEDFVDEKSQRSKARDGIEPQISLADELATTHLRETSPS